MTEVETLRDEIERLRRALRLVRDVMTMQGVPELDYTLATVRSALGEDVPTPPESRDTPTTGAGTAAYEEGYLHGLREYAHWKDGVQYVGTCGKTLADAIAEFKDERCMPSAASGAAGATTAAAWVPVGERLPEPGTDVLTWGVHGQVLVDARSETQDAWSCAYRSKDVTHWMPLPQPPDAAASDGLGTRGGRKA